VLETCVDGKGNTSEPEGLSGELRAALGLTEKGIIHELVRIHRSKSDISRILNIDQK